MQILEEAASIERQLNQREDSATPVFSFVEGVLVQALKNGHWILLDEINLAPPETLQRLEGEQNAALKFLEQGLPLLTCMCMYIYLSLVRRYPE